MPKTATAYPTLTFTDEAVPENPGSAPNPFTEVVAALAKNWDKDKDTSKGAKSVTIPVADAKRLRSRVAEAAKAAGKSARVRFTTEKGEAIVKDAFPKTGNVVMRFWLRPGETATETAPGEGDDN